MIPRTYPSRVNSTTGRVEALVSFISSTTGLQRWVDYTPVAFVTDATPVEGSFDNDGYIAVADVGSTTGLQAGKDYIRVYLDPNATDAWRVNSVGFIPVGYSGIGGIPYALFANNEQGVWYDPSDRTTLFQDSAGTTPVTAVEQPVGLMLDKSKGLVLGSELVTNGGGSTLTGWTLVSDAGTTVAASGGQFVFTTPSTKAARLRQSFSVTAGKTYLVTAYVNSNNVGASSFDVWGTGYGTGSLYSVGNGVAVNRVVTAYVTATGSALYLQIQSYSSSGDVTTYFDNISVRELPGNHAFQTTSTSRPVLSARYNLLTKTEQFDDAAWTKSNVTATANATTAPDGTLTADALIENTTNAQHQWYQQPTVIAATHIFSLYAKRISGSSRYFAIYPQGATAAWAVFDLATGTITATGGANYSASSITSVGDGWYKCSVTFTTIAASLFSTLYLTNSSGSPSNSYTGDGTSGIYIWGADLRVTNDAAGQPAYQRVNTATDYDTTGFKPYLRFDGTDDWLQTNSINFTGTDKMTVWVGGRTLSNTNYGGIVGLSANINDAGAFLIWLRSSTGGGQTDAYARGSTSATTGSQTSNSAITVPSAFVYTTQYDIAQANIADEIKLRWNGAALASTGTSTAGTGNFANAALTIGQYNSSNRFNGRIYGLIVRGAATTTATIQATETYMNGKTGAY